MWNRICLFSILSVGALALLFGSGAMTCRAQLISSFEHNLSSSVGATWDGPGIINSEYVTTGATEGTTALAIHHVPGWTIQGWLKAGLPLAQAAATHDFLLIDVTSPDNGIAGDGWSPAWRQVIPVFNSNQGGWQQTEINYPVAPDDGSSLTTTVIVDLAASGIKANAQAYVDSGGGPGTWWELFLPLQGGDQGTVVKAGDYGDNGAVDAADYVAWRNNTGGASLTNETVSLGSVDAADYAEWKAHFGTDYSLITTIIDNVRFANAGAGAGASTPTPEPSSVMLALAAAMGLVGFRRTRI